MGCDRQLIVIDGGWCDTELSCVLLLFLGFEAEPVLVDSSAPRRQTVEPEQLPYGHDPSPRRGGGYTGTYTLQGYLLPYLGGALLVSTSSLSWDIFISSMINCKICKVCQE